MAMTRAQQMGLMKRIKPVLFALCLMPLGWQLWRLYSGAVIDPVDEFTVAGGQWTLRFLFATLAVTPIRILTGFGAIITIRRMLGLFTFFYGCIHLSIFVGIDHFFDWSAIFEDITERRYVIAGTTAVTLMLPLAVTSFNRAIKFLGARRWQLLHRLIYVTAGAALLHYFWLVKSDYTEPVIYAAILTLLFGVRITHWLKRANTRKAKQKKKLAKTTEAAVNTA